MQGFPSRSFAVVGSGVAGLTAAYLLSAQHRVTLFEADDRLGGHAHTHDVPLSDGRTVSVDSGFIVHNDRTYPTLLRIFDELGVATQDTDMSMSIRNEQTGLEYAGALGLSGLFPTIRTATRGRYLLMLGEVRRFHRAARRLLDTPEGSSADEPLTEFVARERFSPYFVDNFLLPVVAAVWSCDATAAAAYPARYLFTFLNHHGMLSVFGSPAWRTVSGGSARYVEKIAGAVTSSGGSIHLGARVTSVREDERERRVIVEAAGVGTLDFDGVVIAAHPHQALATLDDPTELQQRVLSAITYAPKHAVLHTDSRLLPRARRARASWNYQIRDQSDVAVTYDLTRLMRLSEADPRMLVTLGRTDLVDPSAVIAEMTYEHPLYTTGSVGAQQLLPDIATDRIAFAGAYHGWGFHEDGARSGVEAAGRLGVTWSSQPAVVPV